MCMLMTKEKLTEFVEDMSADGHELEDFVEGIAQVGRNFKRMTTTLESASARLVAAAYCAVPPDDDPGGGLEAAA